MIKNNGVKNVYIHIFTDGRDVSPTSGIKYIEALEKKLKTIGIGSIASIGGRYYGMDRDNRFDRVVNKNLTRFEIHDRVNYAVTEANLKISKEERKVTLDLTIDTNICPVLDYFEIFMERTMMSKYAAKYLQIWFELVINGTKLL